MRTVEFRVVANDPSSAARVGELRTPHGRVKTPAFMPLGTGGAVKAMLPEEVEATGAEIILGNTFHLMLRPGHDVVRRLGGLHAFMQWRRPILTDSGGFQVWSLKDRRTICEAGVEFRSPYDGSLHMLSPERAVEVQEALGSDIAMAFDECPGTDQPREYVEASVDRTTRWLDRCMAARQSPSTTSLFGIVQGGRFEDLRERHLLAVTERDLDGYAIGGVAVGEAKVEMHRIIRATAPRLPMDRPRYLMGVGLPDDLVAAVGAGVDMFDCAVPTRNARNGRLFTSDGIYVVKHASHREDARPIDERCECPTCARYSRAYIRHLFMIDEILVHRLTTMHNLWFFQRFMDRIRSAVEAGSLDAMVQQAAIYARPEPVEGR